MNAKNIHFTRLISTAGERDFKERLDKAIDEIQSMHYTVEVQYNAVVMCDEYNYPLYTALVIGRDSQ